MASPAERELALLQESHQLTVEAKVELERTVENCRQQLRAVGGQYSAARRQVAVSQAECAELRDLLRGKEAPPLSAAVQHATNAQAVAEARATSAEAQVRAAAHSRQPHGSRACARAAHRSPVTQAEALEEALRLSRAESERHLAHIAHLEATTAQARQTNHQPGWGG